MEGVSRPIEWTDEHRLVIFILSLVMFFLTGFLFSDNGAFMIMWGVFIVIISVGASFSFYRARFYDDSAGRSFIVFSTVLMLVWFAFVMIAIPLSKSAKLASTFPPQVSLAILGFLTAFIFYLVGGYVFDYLYDINYDSYSGIISSFLIGIMTAFVVYSVTTIVIA